MKTVINAVLLVIIAILAYVLFGSIREPVAFKAEKERREEAVIQKLIEIRKAQELYRGITGAYASNFDTLADVLRNGRFAIISVTGDADNPNAQEVVRDTVYKSAIDSVRTLGLSLDSLRYVPFGKGATFSIAADTVTYQSTVVNVVEVGVPRKVFMGKYADTRFAKYDDSYDPNSILKFGNLNAPNISGNWER